MLFSKFFLKNMIFIKSASSKFDIKFIKSKLNTSPFRSILFFTSQVFFFTKISIFDNIIFFKNFNLFNYFYYVSFSRSQVKSIF